MTTQKITLDFSKLLGSNGTGATMAGSEKPVAIKPTAPKMAAIKPETKTGAGS